MTEKNILIGGSDVGAIMGLNPFKTSYDVWLEKLKYVEKPEQSEAMEIGLTMQEPILNLFQKRTGIKLQSEKYPDDLRIHPVNKFCIAQIDAHTDDGVFDAKNVGYDLNFGIPFTDAVPEYDYLQLQWQMYCSGEKFRNGTEIVLFSKARPETGRRLNWYYIPRDDELLNMVFEKVKHFYEYNLLQKIEPDNPSGSRIKDYFKNKYPRDEFEMMEADAEIDEMAHLLNELKKESQEITGKIETVENKIKLRIAHHSGIQGEGYKFTWKKNKDSIKTDWESIARELKVSKELIEKYSKTVEGSRVFRAFYEKN